MKKLLIALSLSILMLSGCGIFRSHHAWEEAKQENPLEIPPSLDRPSTTSALVIPPPTDTAQANAPQTPAPAAPSPAPHATSLHLDDDVDTAYKRVGQALERGDLGSISAQDDSAHMYQLQVGSQQSLGQSQSFLQKHFSNVQDETSSTSTLDVDGGTGTSTTVTLRVQADPDGGSTVGASGDPTQAARIISVLKGRLGG